MAIAERSSRSPVSRRPPVESDALYAVVGLCDDRLALDAFAARAGDRVWTVRPDTLLSAIDSGRTGQELVGFLADHTTHGPPAALTTLVADVTARAGRLRDLGVARLVDCAEPAPAALIARDRHLRTLCQPVGERHLAVPLDREAAFRSALHSPGYALPPSLPPDGATPCG